jgi:hypothetical protein
LDATPAADQSLSDMSFLLHVDHTAHNYICGEILKRNKPFWQIEKKQAKLKMSLYI